MNSASALSAYKKTIKHTENPRQIERRILARMNNCLIESRERFDGSPAKPERLQILSDGLRDALSDNLKLWQIFKNDLVREGNALPGELRADLLSLAIFVETHTTRVLVAEGNVGALIDVNNSILGALSGQTGEVA
ncbi:flagellar biosynthesis regulator FlaF [Pontibaca salina]|uniref:Flagellar biosynthesis regulator FlaF n=1 Tax=Pontibaca salina TaxID=2795731 RepID=A0A934M1D3_9RHOB|nr:flagellar biosynthesis regulator FlaF [Pontibaca salina]MBI6630925.1 flagellar biosynthesis regulator FlaF [Pontibaca salina]